MIGVPHSVDSGQQQRLDTHFQEWMMALSASPKLLLPVAVLGTFIGVADAQYRRQNTPGQFDYYVLALSWSPSFCETATGNARRQQCGARPFSFVVHGLWPQYERGFPESCLVLPQRLDRNIMRVCWI